MSQTKTNKKITSIIYIYDDGTFKHVDILRPPTLTEEVPKPVPALKPVPPNPLTAPWPNTLPNPTAAWYGNCPSCGLKLDKVMGYVCSNPNCPTGLAPAYCGVGQ